MFLCLPLAACVLSTAGPIDAYRANLASVKVAADFECKFWYNYQPASLKHVFAFEPGAGPAGEPGYVIQGRWEYDGSSERYVVRATGGSLFVPGQGRGPISPVEALCDDETFALHYLMPGESNLHVHALAAEFPVTLVGPFTWYTSQRFDRDLAVNYAGAAPVRSTGERGGHPTEVEIYERNVGDSRIRREVAYDPGIGYLPRFYRKIAYGMDQGRSAASVSEFYLTDAKPCAAGGFVPTEWFLIHYNLEDFDSKYPGYDENTKLQAPARSDVVHYKVTRLDDKKGPARLEELSGVNQILAPGGILQSKDDYAPMSMVQLKSTLGAKARPTNRPIAPRIDLAEKQEFDRPKASSNRPLYYILGGLSLAAVAAFLIRRRSMASVLLLGLIPLNGCGQKPVPRLTAAFTQPRVLYDPSRPTLNLDLQISNAGNQTLRIIKIDAGCSCRQVNPAQLPATLKPGGRMNVAVGMSGGRNFSPQSYLFTFTTDQGLLTAPVALLSLPTHHLTPDTVTLSGLNDKSTEGEASFDLVHREVYRPGARDADVSLIVPDGFAREERGVHEGRVADAPDLAFRDTEYHLTLKDRTLGLHRADIVLKGAEGRKLTETPLVWQRLPFLSSVPDRVALSTRPARVFLRCPDESVELSRVASAPPGVKADLDSPRSIRVTMTEDAPATLDGFVEVETTAVDSAPLRIPIARYAPVAQK